MKKTILSVAISTTFFYALSQNPEKILQRQSSNLKEPSDSSLNLFDKGVTPANNKKYALSNRNYELAITLDSDYVDAYNNLGLNFYEMNLLDSARHYLLISLKKLPSGTTALQNLGLVEEKMGDLPKALSHYKQIISIDPESPEGYYNAARALITMGKLEEGLMQAQQAEKIYTKLKSSSLSDCHYLIFVAYYNLQNKSMAKKYLIMCKNENVEIPSEMEHALK